MRPIRILLIHETTGGFGDRIRIDNIYRFLQKSGFKVHEAVLPSMTFGYAKSKGMFEILTSLLPLRKLKPYDLRKPVLQYINLNLARNYLDHIGRISDFDIVLAETSLVGWLTLGLCKRNSKPLIVDVHGLAGAEAKGNKEKSWHTKEILEAEVFKRCTHLLVVSNKMKEYITDNFKISHNKIHIVYNGAHPQKLKAEYKHPLKVIYAGVFAFWERVDDYLEIAKKANSGDFEFYLAGSGPMKKHILAQIKTERIPIKYLGYLPRSKMLRVMSKMQIGIAPSTKDTTRLVAFPIKVLDYMSCGLPVVTPNVGDWGRMVEIDDCGVALKDDSIANYLTSLETLKRKSLWQDKSSKGSQAIEIKYNWNRVLSPLKNLIMQLCGIT